jgi:hypothetical protein
MTLGAHTTFRRSTLTPPELFVSFRVDGAGITPNRTYHYKRMAPPGTEIPRNPSPRWTKALHGQRRLPAPPETPLALPFHELQDQVDSALQCRSRTYWTGPATPCANKLAVPKFARCRPARPIGRRTGGQLYRATCRPLLQDGEPRDPAGGKTSHQHLCVAGARSLPSMGNDLVKLLEQAWRSLDDLCHLRNGRGQRIVQGGP